ncbi:MAG: acyl-ACP--UDP-N-acetylglucosamine O-acyltransferase [Puniceicoccales bacterium]|jgi:UDP-N-acetylglucosamine acyltransferase|nr:acyl-ACP--UDP-N-acetylglucosamine O-acyltransferase [Puniceicoccales bacterium]
MARIHGSAIVGGGVSFGSGVTIGPYAVIGDGVTIGDGTTIGSHAEVKTGTTIGSNCLVDSFAAIGGLPQDESFDEKIRSGVTIGDNACIREHVTVHRASEESSSTKIGSGCMLQSGSHVAHDCTVGDGSILASGSMLGGHAVVGKKCFIGGGSAVHQWVTIGDCVILGGASATALNIPPYAMAFEVSTVIGLNLVGLRRAKISSESIVALKNCFREFYARVGNFADRAKRMMGEGFASTEETKNFLNFFLIETKRGFAPKRRRIRQRRTEC